MQKRTRLQWSSTMNLTLTDHPLGADHDNASDDSFTHITKGINLMKRKIAYPLDRLSHEYFAKYYESDTECRSRLKREDVVKSTL
ncbi:hypothetical protein HZS_5620 [Henneguya salminicola]|nr:hypothetical protein HZS_5620 [Henneguya salminicola]